MKKILFCFSILLILSSTIFAQELTVTNTIGGNSDKLDGDDLIDFSLINSDGKLTYSPFFTIADRLQVDFNYNWFTTRGRLDAYLSTNSPNYAFRFNGFAKIQPIQQIGLIAGNSFFNQLGMAAGELYALDDTPTYGKLFKDGVGLVSTIPFGKSKINLKMAGGFEFDSFYQSSLSDWIYSGGLEVSKKDLFSVGATARNFTKGAYGKYSVMAGFYPGDFLINAGFVYNNTYDDILPCEAKYSLSLSGGYKNKALGLGIFADVVTGLTNEHLSTSDQKTKYYYGYIPFMAALRGSYEIIDDLTAGLSVKYTKLLYKANTSTFEIYPNAEYAFNKLFSLTGGLKFKLDTSSSTVLTDYSIPLSFKIKWKTSF